MIGRRLRLVLSLAVAFVVVALLPPSPRAPWTAGRSTSSAHGSDRSATECAFDDARRLKRAMAGKLDAERAELRQQAIGAYQSVYSEAGMTDPDAVEAAFRVGELARAGGDVESARAAFAHATSGVPGLIAHRARLELGHLARRCGDVDGAMREYEMLLLGPCEEPYVRDEALFWLARVRGEAGRTQAALDSLNVLRRRLDDGTLLERVERELRRITSDSHAERTAR